MRFQSKSDLLSPYSHLSSWMSQLVCAAFTVYIAAMNSLYVLLILPLPIFGCLMLLKYYMRTYQEVSRVESITCSPVLTHLSETLSGSSTIRAFGRGTQFTLQNSSLLNTHSNAHFWQISLNSWIAVRAEFLSMGILIFTSVFCVSKVG